MFQLVLSKGRNFIAQRSQIEDRAVELLKDQPDYQLLKPIPGIGPINALTILVEARDPRLTLWMAGQFAILPRANRFWDKFERYIANDRHNILLRRKAYTAIAAKMTRTVHGIIKHGEPYRPFFKG